MYYFFSEERKQIYVLRNDHSRIKETAAFVQS